MNFSFGSQLVLKCWSDGFIRIILTPNFVEEQGYHYDFQTFEVWIKPQRKNFVLSKAKMNCLITLDNILQRRRQGGGTRERSLRNWKMY